MLTADLNALAGAASQRSLDAAQRKQIETVVRALPETGFDWAEAMQREEAALVVGVRMNTVPTLKTQDLGALHATVVRITDALRLPPDRTRTLLTAVDVGVSIAFTHKNQRCAGADPRAVAESARRGCEIAWLS